MNEPNIYEAVGRMSLEEYAAEAAKKIPDHLFKYRSLAGEKTKERVRDLIVNQRLFFAAPDDLNDPFECKPHLMTKATVAQRKQHAAGMIKRHEGDRPRGERRRKVKAMNRDPNYSDVMMKSMGATLGALGIFSLSAKADDLLMWPHYADNHRGVCVAFDVNALLRAEQSAFPVLYREERPICDVILEPTERWLNKAVLTKGKPWEYEAEWRIIRSRGAREVVQLAAPTISGVLLGANISPADRADILQWAREAGRPLTVAQARFHPTAYRLEIEELA